MLVVHAQHDRGASVREYVSRAVAGEAPSQQRGRLFHDVGIRRVQREPQPLGPRPGGDVAVSEVETEQLGVVVRREGDPAHRLPAPLASDRQCRARVSWMAPVADRRARNAEPASDLAVVDSRGDELEGCGAEGAVVHEHMFAQEADGKGAARPLHWLLVRPCRDSPRRYRLGD